MGDSAGLDPDAVVQTPRLGLRGMRERAEILGSTLAVESGRTGRTLVVEVPDVYSDPDRG